MDQEEEEREFERLQQQHGADVGEIDEDDIDDDFGLDGDAANDADAESYISEDDKFKKNEAALSRLAGKQRQEKNKKKNFRVSFSDATPNDSAPVSLAGLESFLPSMGDGI